MRLFVWWCSILHNSLHVANQNVTKERSFCDLVLRAYVCYRCVRELLTIFYYIRSKKLNKELNKACTRIILPWNINCLHLCEGDITRGILRTSSMKSFCFSYRENLLKVFRKEFHNSIINYCTNVKLLCL